MSHIPNSAMPHAGPSSDESSQQDQGGFLSGRAGQIAEKVRENPKTAIAAGAAVIAGVAAAAAIPLVRGRGKESRGSGKGSKSSK